MALAAAAGVVAFAAVGIGPLGLFDGLASDDGESAGGAAEEAPAPALADEGSGQIGADQAGGPAKISSGADYAPDSPLFLIGAAPAAPELAPEETGRSLAGEDDAGESLTAPPPPLDRIWAEPEPCVAAVADVHEPPPVTVRRMDFASFEGEPAVVIWIITGDSAEWVWVAGPDCGTPEAGPDGRYQTQVR